MRSPLNALAKSTNKSKKSHGILSVLAAMLIAVFLLPFASQPAYADDPVIVESLDGTATPTVRSIAVPYQTPTAPDIKLSSTDPVFEAGGSVASDVAWHYKKSDDTWAIMPGGQQFLEGAYRYHVCVMCPDENYTFADTATLIIDDETWTLIKKEKLSTGIEYALFASPEINLPDEQLDSPEPIKKTGDTPHDCRISWTEVDKAKGYEITVKNTTQGFAPKEMTFEVGASTNTYDLKDVFKSLSIRTGHNTFIITVKALAPAGYKDSDPASSPTSAGSQWGFTIEQHLNLTVDAATATASWDPYPFEEAQYYYYRLVYGTTDGKQIVDGYFEKSKTTFAFDTNIEYFHGEAGKYYLYVVAMDRTRTDGGFELTEQDYVEYDYAPKVKTISVNGVKQPMEGDLAQAYIGDYSIEEANLSLPDPGSGSAYWRRHEGGAWVAMEPTEKFEVSGEYRISIPVRCDEGYTFATDAVVSINGETVAAEIDVINDTTVRIECPMDVIALSNSTYVVTAGALNVRSDASTASERVGGLSFGDVVQAVGQNGIWTMIDFEGKTAWVNASYLALTESAASAFEDGPVKYTVTAEAMNVRSTPETPTGDGNRIGGITAGEEILATGSVTDGEGRVWVTMDYYDPSHPENGHRLGYVMFSRPNSASSSGTTYYFNNSDLPPTKSSGKEDAASDELVIDTGSYPKVSFAPYKAAISVGNTASLTDENFENKDDGYLLTTVYPDDGMNFTSLTKDKVKLPEAFTGMEVKTLTLNSDGSVTLKLGPVDSPETPEVSYAFSKGADGTWTKGSSDGYELIVNRSVDDDQAYSLFTGIEVDGTMIDAADYTASSGSLNATIDTAYLETLSTGAHDLKVNFQDGSAETTVSIKAAANGHSSNDDENGGTSASSKNKTGNTGAAASANSRGIPRTSDDTPVALLAGLALASLAVIVILLVMRKRNSSA